MRKAASVLLALALAFANAALAQSEDPRAEWKLRLIYLGAAGSAYIAVPLVTALTVSAALSPGR